MKKSTLYFLIVVINLFSCIKEQTLKNENTPTERTAPSKVEKWQLITMTGSMANSERTGDDMAWQEYYLLHPDNTFIKSREESGNESQAGGTYQFVTLSGDRYLELNYKTDHRLIGNCTGEAKEYLMIQSENKMSGTWNICDGPGLEYKKVKG
ncbi:hypothetical protein FNH22_17215 [Fulvivirga sp. M361]|uniref:hypothetical protein n=1 Tax=Fulvivirga sp. M361 TaxID=2594266 RepID=UPI001179B328|nr:hypothetical protein [Fulvivirga sp. M361]TRX56118.1 hypothetical protein FNH22_17215 [Fulvivirga sp. M361]